MISDRFEIGAVSDQTRGQPTQRSKPSENPDLMTHSRVVRGEPAHDVALSPVCDHHRHGVLTSGEGRLPPQLATE